MDSEKDSLANGEIGIFYLNGNTYIKELHDEPDGVYLISLNQKYRPIQVLESDSFKIFGKVIGKCKGAEIPISLDFNSRFMILLITISKGSD